MVEYKSVEKPMSVKKDFGYHVLFEASENSSQSDSSDSDSQSGQSSQSGEESERKLV